MTGTTLDPELSAAGQVLRDHGLAAPPPHVSALAEARAGYDSVGEFVSGRAEESSSIEQRDILIPGPHGTIPCILVQDVDTPRPRPVLAYFHGGGFSLGRARDWVGLARDLVRESGCAVLLVDYRLAPEHRFPAAFTEAVSVLGDLRSNGLKLDLDPDRIAVGGDSSGANLALSAALHSPDIPLRALLLFYGVYSRDISSPAWSELGGFGLSPELMGWIWQNYLGDAAADERAAPLAMEVGGLPPVIQVVGDLDPLIEDAKGLAAKLSGAGVENRLTVEAGLNHGFVRLGPLAPRVAAVVREAACQLRAIVSAPVRERRP